MTVDLQKNPLPKQVNPEIGTFSVISKLIRTTDIHFMKETVALICDSAFHQ